MAGQPIAADRRFLTVLLVGWLLLVFGAAMYARVLAIPAWAAAPIAAAILIEFPFYLLPAFQKTRLRTASHGRIPFAFLLWGSSLAPFLVYSTLTGTFHLQGFLLLLAAAGLVSFWYVLLPTAPVADVLFLTLLAGMVAGKLFDQIYFSPVPKLNLSFLGKVMLIRTGALAVLHLRAAVKSTPDYRFWPTSSEWLTGFRYFALLMPVTGIVYWGLGLVDLREHPLNVLQALGTFFGILWVTALSEEFFFRGLLQQWIESWTASAGIALLTASLLFGSAHLGMHNQFPNWRFATVAAVAGFFYGLAWRSSRSVQASMVAHALTVTVWKTFLH